MKYVYIHTIGCQMNVYDSQQMERILSAQGYAPVAEPEKADLILLNTCAIREKAEQKAFSFLGRLSRLKGQHPGLVIGVGGCVAQQEGGRIFSRIPHVDFVFGTHAIARLPDILSRVKRGARHLVDQKMDGAIREIEAEPPRPGPISRFVTIMQGCDNYCTYCVVPYVRGREMSRHPDAILAEIEALVAAGGREVTLLGQNVNSYGRKEGWLSFARLLSRINDIQGLKRIRFTTSHPKDLSEELIAAFGRLEKLCRHIHLPVQSGSDAVLKRMHRKYTVSAYLEKIAALRAVCPDIAVSSDMIVGFPGESEADFEASLALLREVRFDGLFAFKYSDRPMVPAARFQNKLAPAQKNARLQAVLALQETITREKNQEWVGHQPQVLVENRDYLSDADRVQWSGRTSCNRIVHFGSADTKTDYMGQLMRVTIQRALSHSLSGQVPEHDPFAKGLQGESHAA